MIELDSEGMPRLCFYQIPNDEHKEIKGLPKFIIDGA